MDALASSTLTTIPFCSPCEGAMPTPRMRKPPSPSTSPIMVHTLVVPTSIAPILALFMFFLLTDTLLHSAPIFPVMNIPSGTEKIDDVLKFLVWCVMKLGQKTVQQLAAAHSGGRLLR